ncbi:hypothetical protein GCM10023314_15820 [Algibacter agarivorans]|uniref:Lipoprotein n=2 Tax=Algibacter agarivorans TaxID=1109741 RepID=A0ABP9GKR2_9FLAO
MLVKQIHLVVHRKFIMKAIDRNLKLVTFFFVTLMLLQSCTVYKTPSVTLDEASKSNSKVRVKTIDNQSLKFDRIQVADNKVYGSSIINREMIITTIEKDNIEKIQLKDKTTSTILTIVSLAGVTLGMFVLIIESSLNHIGSSN